MDIKRLLHATSRKWWLIVLLVILGGGITNFISKMSVPVYQAETTLYAMNRDKFLYTGESQSYDDILMSQRLVQDYSQIISSKKIINAVQMDLNNPNLSESNIKSMISVETKQNSNVLAVIARYHDPKVCADVANAISQELISQMKKITNSDRIAILDEAKAPDRPLPGKTSRNMLIGAFLGFILAMSFIYINTLFDKTIRSAEDIESTLKIRVVGIIPEHDIH